MRSDLLKKNIEIDVDLFDKISRETPHLCSIIPAGSDEMADIDDAGGIPAVLSRLKDMIKDSPTVNGNLIKKVALITDGRFSVATTGPCLGHVEMEAYNGGPIGAIKDGDIIEIDIPNRKLNVKLSDAEINERLKNAQIPERKLTPLLESYREKFAGINCYGK